MRSLFASNTVANGTKASLLIAVEGRRLACFDLVPGRDGPGDCDGLWWGMGGGGAANWWGIGGGIIWLCADVIARDGVGVAESFSRRDSIVANFSTSFPMVVSNWSSLLVFSWTINSRSSGSTFIGR